MPVTTQLFAYGLRQVLGVTEESASQFVEVAEASGPAGKIIALVRRRFTDHSQALPKALNHANERAWQALAVSLAGDGLLERIKAFFSGPAPQALQEQVKAFLAHNAARFDTTGEQVRRACLSELHQARKKGLLSATPDADEIGRQAAAYRGLNDPGSLLADARQAALGVADALPGEYPHLARLLRQGEGEAQPPLLVAAFAHFFRREVQTNEELARGLTFDLLRKVAASQEVVLGEMGQALVSLGGRFDALLGEVLEELEQIRKVGDDTNERVAALQATVEELREDIRKAARQHDIRPDRLSRRVAVTINIAQEQERLRHLWGLYEKLPAEAHVADDLLLLGDLLEAAALFALAQKCHETAGRAARVQDQSREAEAHFKAYRNGCQRRSEAWPGALESLLKAARLDPVRFLPFPLDRYFPERILGSGGFGTVYLCRDEYSKRKQVAVKSLHTVELARTIDEVFAEAQTLHDLKHDAIVGVRWWDFAGPARSRPYIVMDYFPGRNLQEYLDEHGVLPPADFLVVARQVAAGMLAAHNEGVLHRDLKPENVLVSRDRDRWQVKIIDFGLAVAQADMATSVARQAGRRSVEDQSFAGTYKYAPPEQKGELSGTPLGKYSDVYTFGKTCCEALFGTTEPKSWDYEGLPPAYRPLGRLLERCTAGPLKHRPASFEVILQELEALDPEQVDRRRREAEERQREQQQREQERREEGERRLGELVRQALERTQGQPKQADTEAARALCKEAGILTERANAIIREERQRWREKVEQREREAQRQRQQREEAERQRREAEQRQQRANLSRWKESRDLRQWVEEHQGQWNHQDWLALLDRVKQSSYWPLNPAEMGAVLEEVKDAWLKDQRERQAGEAVTNSGALRPEEERLLIILRQYQTFSDPDDAEAFYYASQHGISKERFAELRKRARQEHEREQAAASSACPACGASLLEGAVACMDCGFLIGSGGSGAAAAKEDVNLCPNPACGVANPPGVHYCGRCAAPLPLPLGVLIHGKYRVKKHLATGGFALIYLAEELRTKRDVVIKEMICNDPQEFAIRLNFFRREAEALRMLGPVPAVPRLLDLLEQGTTAHLVMEFVPGRDLLKVMQDNGNRPFPVDQVAEWSGQVCDVLGYMHAQSPPWVYRDMKPDNVMLLPDGKSVKLLDFGTARDLGKTVKERMGTRTRVYTEGYAPPEQIVGKPEPRSDLFALAATMFHLVTGQVPEGFFTAREVEAKLAEPGAIPNGQRWFYELIRTNLAEDVEERYHTAAEIKADLEKRAITREASCPGCGQVNKVRTPSCGRCKRALTPLRNCFHCGQAYPLGSRSCPGCGNRVR